MGNKSLSNTLCDEKRKDEKYFEKKKPQHPPSMLYRFMIFCLLSQTEIMKINYQIMINSTISHLIFNL